MKLDDAQIKEIVTGAAHIEEENGTVRVYRFTKEQEELYRKEKPDMWEKVLSSAGIKLSFRTDSKTLFLKMSTAPGSSRKYISFDVFVNGELIGYLDNFSDVTLPQDYTQMDFPMGTFEKSFLLGGGVKDVCVHLPWSASTAIEQVVVDDGAFVEGVRPQKKLLAFGDSITQGYDALRPSNRYVSKLAETLGAEEFNKAIGGEVFFPPLSTLKEAFVPDYITVAYGTNDWNSIDEQTFCVRCKEFYTNISKNYPTSKIFAMTPIWRKDMNGVRVYGAFGKVEENIREAVKNLENVTVISGFDFVPKDEKYFADLRLHPNDEGFGHYSKSLCNKIFSYKLCIR